MRGGLLRSAAAQRSTFYIIVWSSRVGCIGNPDECYGETRPVGSLLNSNVAPQVGTGWHGPQHGSCCCAPSRRSLKQRRFRLRLPAGTGSTRLRPRAQRRRRHCKRGQQIYQCSERSETSSEVSLVDRHRGGFSVISHLGIHKRASDRLSSDALNTRFVHHDPALCGEQHISGRTRADPLAGLLGGGTPTPTPSPTPTPTRTPTAPTVVGLAPWLIEPAHRNCGTVPLDAVQRAVQVWQNPLPSSQCVTICRMTRGTSSVHKHPIDWAEGTDAPVPNMTDRRPADFFGQPEQIVDLHISPD